MASNNPRSYDEVVSTYKPVDTAATGTEQEPPSETQASQSKSTRCVKLLKKIGVAYAAIGLFLTLPLCIAMLYIGLSDGPNVNGTDPIWAPRQPFYVPDRTTLDTLRLSRMRCRAQQNLPAYLMVSALGAVVGLIAVAMFFIIGKDNRNELDTKATRICLQILSWIGVFVLIFFYTLGSIATFQMMIHQSCDPFSSEGCPYSYCDNRLMIFSYIFYPSSMILLSPFWIYSFYFSVVSVRDFACREEKEENGLETEEADGVTETSLVSGTLR